MAVQIIDRRLSGKNKSVGNRERFIRRYRQQITEAVRRAVSTRGIREIDQAENVTIPKKDISEPIFRHGQGGVRDTVHPGNREYVTGDRIERPEGGGGSGGSQASDSGEGQDDFIFTLTREEFMQLFFEDLALPRLLRTHIAENPTYKLRRSGYSQDGTPNNLAIVRSMRGALGRRIALTRGPQRELDRLKDALAVLLLQPEHNETEAADLREHIARLEKRIRKTPWLDPIDLRFRAHQKVPEPFSRAVMFCVMDVSGSMDEERKDLAKRFFILLYLFLTRHYRQVEIVFIRHHTQAAEVDEQEFFYSQESGGTVVSSALVLLEEIIRARYPAGDWNIYVAQASDGDNFSNDSGNCRTLLEDKILPLVRYYAYLQVAEEEQNLWQEYSQLLAAHPEFAMRKVAQASEIYPVFRELFRKEGVQA